MPRVKQIPSKKVANKNFPRGIHPSSPMARKLAPSRPMVVLQPNNRADDKKIIQKRKARAAMLRCQRSTQPLIPKAAFHRLVGEVVQEMSEARLQSTAVDALQEASEAFLVEMFQAGRDCATHAGRVSVTPEDLQLALRLRRY